MAKFELKLPKMGESVAEATITNWLKKVGDKIEVDEAVLEIATDKVDSEIPSEISGVLSEILFNVDDIVKVGQTIAIIETEAQVPLPEVATPEVATPEVAPESIVAVEEIIEKAVATVSEPANFSSSEKFFSPLVKNIAKQEGVSISELEAINGSGKEGRVTKEDILKFVESLKSNIAAPVSIPTTSTPQTKAAPVSVNGGDEIVEMDRMRKLISGYMMASINTQPGNGNYVVTTNGAYLVNEPRALMNTLRANNITEANPYLVREYIGRNPHHLDEVKALLRKHINETKKH